MLKKYLPSLLSTLLFCNVTYAVYPGAYIGAIAGYSSTNNSATQAGLTSADVNTSGLGGGFIAGYQINPNFGLEYNFTYFPEATFKNINGNANSTGTVNEYASALFLKGTCPISDFGFNLTAKGGFAYLIGTASNSITQNNNAQAPNQSRFLPAYGVGISYDITPTLPIELSWTRIAKGSNLQNADLAGISVSYFFG